MGVTRLLVLRTAVACVLFVACVLGLSVSAAGELQRAPLLPVQLLSLDLQVVPNGRESSELDGTLARDIKRRLQGANVRENAAWEQVTTRALWETYRDQRLKALRDSLGQPLSASGPPRTRVTGHVEGDGYKVEKLVFETRPGLVATANLYVPSTPTKMRPGILIVHSHHNPKAQGELQDMGMTWARQGCEVLIMDELGHGERRQHPFRTSSDYSGPFRVGRQDYYFRYNMGLQLSLIGESLMGWMVWDIRRALDLLSARPAIDKDRIILLGSVAGGGDPAAVAAALDSRVRALVPFNFGGPQPDYAIPADGGREFYYFGVPEWESTRCLRLGARDGFAQWLIVASVAPRRLIYAHEFAWDQPHDPAWPRLQHVFDWYRASDHLAVVTGRGSLRGSPPASSHCNNIGPLHRSGIYPILARWFAMPIPAEYSRRRAPEELDCLTPDAMREFRPRPLHELASHVGAEQIAAARRHLAVLDRPARRRWLREGWARLLGDFQAATLPSVPAMGPSTDTPIPVERISLKVGGEVALPLALLFPPVDRRGRIGVVIGVAQEGKQAFLEHRSEAISDLLGGGLAICLVDVRGTGETKPPGGSRRHNGVATELSAAEWLLGETLVCSRLRDLGSVLVYLRGRSDIDAGRIAVWGDSFAAPNPPGRDLAVPMDAEPYPGLAEPLGGLLALFGALFDDGIRAVVVRGGLIGYHSVLDGPFFHVPHDAFIPGALTMGELADVAASLAPVSIRLEGLVDGLNRPAPADVIRREFEPARAAYRSAGAEPHFEVGAGEVSGRETARWLLHELRGP
jgi:dienelactone hydrolase